MRALRGRRACSHSGKLQSDVADALISLWTVPKRHSLRFMQIHGGLIVKGKVRNEKDKKATARILARAISQGLVRRDSRTGLYFLNVVPDDFGLFDYLRTLRQNSESASYHVGGSFWSLSNVSYLGMPSTVSDYDDSKLILQILTIRIGKIFEALNSLANCIEQRKTTESKILTLPQEVVIQLLLELIPHYLAGLSSDELKEAIQEMVQALPREAYSPNPITRSDMLVNFQKTLDLIGKEDTRTREERRYPKPRDFALIAIPPEDLLDRDWDQKRSVKKILEDYRRKSALFVAWFLLTFDKESVLNVLDIHGQRILGFDKASNVKKLYCKIHACDQIASIITKECNRHSQKARTEALKTIEEYTDKQGMRSIILYLPFSRSHLNLFSPTVQKEKILQRYFPHHSKHQIHTWLKEGTRLWEQTNDELSLTRTERER